MLIVQMQELSLFLEVDFILSIKNFAVNGISQSKLSVDVAKSNTKTPAPAPASSLSYRISVNGFNVYVIRDTT